MTGRIETLEARVEELHTQYDTFARLAFATIEGTAEALVSCIKERAHYREHLTALAAVLDKEKSYGGDYRAMVADIKSAVGKG